MIVDDDKLLHEFVSAFNLLDDMVLPLAQVPPQLRMKASLLPGYVHWDVIRQETQREQLDKAYAQAAGPFPPLFERLLLSYRWLTVDLGILRLIPNPPGASLQGFVNAATADSCLTTFFRSRQVAHFAMGAGIDYDPICFDVLQRGDDGDCRVVRFDHEDILCERDSVKADVVASSFRELVMNVVSLAVRK